MPRWAAVKGELLHRNNTMTHLRRMNCQARFPSARLTSCLSSLTEFRTKADLYPCRLHTGTVGCVRFSPGPGRPICHKLRFAYRSQCASWLSQAFSVRRSRKRRMQRILHPIPEQMSTLNAAPPVTTREQCGCRHALFCSRERAYTS